MKRLRSVLVLSFSLALVACGSNTPGPTPIVAAEGPLTKANYGAYKAEILPKPEELAWEQIPWLPSYGEGLRAASKARKPILLWVMNGHPLGCT